MKRGEGSKEGSIEGCEEVEVKEGLGEVGRVEGVRVEGRAVRVGL